MQWKPGLIEQGIGVKSSFETMIVSGSSLHLIQLVGASSLGTTYSGRTFRGYRQTFIENS